MLPVGPGAPVSERRKQAELEQEPNREIGRAHLRATSDEHVLEVLAGAEAGSAVDVPPVAPVEPQAGALEHLRVELAPVVHDDEERSPGSSDSEARASTAAIPSV